MTKVTLDMNTFKALASDSRLDILRALDGKKMSLKDISQATKLNKATLHEHLTKLNEAGLVKRKEREGHKWVYYKLTWKGEGLLHPENTRIVVLFTTTFLALFVGIVSLVNYTRGYIVGKAVNLFGSDSTLLYEAENTGFNLVPQTMQTFSDTPVASVSLTNQTTSQLSDAFLVSTKYKGVFDNAITAKDLNWESAVGSPELTSVGADELIRDGGTLVGDQTADAASNVPLSMVAIVHDPALQYTAIACIIIFTVLLSIGLWTLWKNKKPKI